MFHKSFLKADKSEMFMRDDSRRVASGLVAIGLAVRTFTTVFRSPVGAKWRIIAATVTRLLPLPSGPHLNIILPRPGKGHL